MVVNHDNNIVHGLWIGKRLSKLELLTLHTFLKQGHQFHLWLYEQLETEIPRAVIVRNANEIIPAEKIYRRKYDDPACGVGKGSVGSPFSDWFRYKLLYETGGWWTDMDVACLKPLDFSEQYVFREHDKVSVIGNLIKVPRNSELMRLAAEKTKRLCNEDTLDWLLPNKLLAATIEELGLSGFIKKNISNRDIWPETKKYIFKNPTLPHEWHALHWMNEEWRTRRIDSRHVPPASALGRLLFEHGIGKKASWAERMLIKIPNPFTQRAT